MLAEFGIVTLLFLLGLELSLQRLWQLRRYVLGVGFAQVALSTLAIGIGVQLAGGGPAAVIVLGLCLALSSTAIVMQLLAEQHRAANQAGRIALSVLLFQDLMVVPILFVVEVMVGGKPAAGVGVVPLIRPFAEALAAVIAIMLVGRFVVRPLLRSAVRTGSRDLIMAITLLILVVFASATGLAGLSVALGAFLAGLLLSESEIRHNIEVDLEPFKGLLLGIFFITVGTNIDVVGMAGDAGWIVLGVVVLLGVKAAILYAVARAFRVARPDAAEIALLLAQAGEFAFVVIGVAGPLLPARLAGGVTAVVGLSMLATPLLAAAARRLAARLAEAEHGEHAPGPDFAGLDNHVVIGGFGRVGRLIAQALEAENVPYVALDTNGEQVARMRLARRPVFFGDAGRPELLATAGGAARPRLRRHRQQSGHRRAHGGGGAHAAARRAGGGARHRCRPCRAPGRARRRQRHPGDRGGEPAACRPPARGARSARGGGLAAGRRHARGRAGAACQKCRGRRRLIERKRPARAGKVLISLQFRRSAGTHGTQQDQGIAPARLSGARTGRRGRCAQRGHRPGAGGAHSAQSGRGRA